MFKRNYLGFFPILLILVLFFVNFDKIRKREKCSFYTSHAKIYKKFYPNISKINLFYDSAVIRKKAIKLCRKEYLEDKNNPKKIFFMPILY